MSGFRIVFNEQTRRYRIEQRRWWGWDFVRDEAGEYATFDDCEQARRHLCLELPARRGRFRRWRVLDLCHRPCAAD